MSKPDTIYDRIKGIRRGRIFSLKLLYQYGTRNEVRYAIGKLIEHGEIERLVPGFFVRPQHHSLFGKILPSYLEVIEKISKERGRKIQVHGVEAIRKLKLSTQMQVRPIFYTDGRSWKYKSGLTVVHIKHVPLSWLQHSGTVAGLAITAFNFLGEKQLESSLIRKTLKQLSSTDIEKLKASKMPSWMRERFEQELSGETRRLDI